MSNKELMEKLAKYEQLAKEYFRNINEPIPVAGALGSRDSSRNLDITINTLAMIDLMEVTKEVTATEPKVEAKKTNKK